MRFVLTMIVYCLINACGTMNPEESDLTYRTFGRGVVGLVGKVKEPKIRICLSGNYGNKSFDQWGDQIRGIVLDWVEPMRSFTAEPLAEDVEILNSQQNCHAKVIVHRNVWAHANIGNSPTINVAQSGYFGSRNVISHEFGHGFALADTYAGGSGQCQAGQPQSLMCNTSFKKPQKDDVDGLKKVFERAFPNDRSGGSGSVVRRADVKVALASANSDSYLLVAAPKKDKLSILGYCEGSQKECEDKEWKSMQGQARSQDANIYAADNALVSPKQVTIRIKKDGESIYRYRTVSLTRRNNAPL